MLRVPEGLVAAVRRREGEAGDRWLAELPDLIAYFCDRWGCTILGEPRHGEVAMVVPVGCAAGNAALKCSLPRPGNIGEAAALRRFDGHGAVRLIREDAEESVLLLERAGPASLTSVTSIPEVLEIAGDLARRLAIPATADAPSLAEAAGLWGAELDEQVAALPGVLSPTAISRARETIRVLAVDQTPTLLHGDLHEGNVLASEREQWLAIDPKGWRGPAEFDTFTIVARHRSRLADEGDLLPELERRIGRFAWAGDLNRDLARACCQARATSAYLHQRLNDGAWFDLDLLQLMAEGCP